MICFNLLGDFVQHAQHGYGAGRSKATSRNTGVDLSAVLEGPQFPLHERYPLTHSGAISDKTVEMEDV